MLIEEEEEKKCNVPSVQVSREDCVVTKHRVEVSNHVWGLGESGSQGASLQLKGDQQRIQMHYSDARKLYQ